MTTATSRVRGSQVSLAQPALVTRLDPSERTPALEMPATEVADVGASLLARYRRRPTVRLRNQLIERYRSMVEAIARALAQRLPASVDVDDLAHAGVWGLIGALDGYRPEFGASFVTFMRIRVRGAMLDELRHLDILPRAYRRRARAREEAAERLRTTLHREPSDAELAAELGVSERRFRLRYATVVRHSADSLDSSVGGRDEEDGGVVDGNACPMDGVDRADLIESIRESLQPIEWKVLRLQYLDGLTGKEVARKLRLSPARVCQIHARVLARLKQRLEAVR